MLPLLIAFVADLHDLGDYRSAHHVAALVTDADLVIYVGDILRDQDRDARLGVDPSCGYATALTVAAVGIVGKPFLFTLGNHDPQKPCRRVVAQALAKHPLHQGACMPHGSATCVHTTLPIATLDSVPTGDDRVPCRGDPASYSCPPAEDVDWVQASQSIVIVATHIPPPESAGIAVHGQVGEQTSCWRPKHILPTARQYYYGHDHNNVYTSHGGKYTALLKSGLRSRLSYGPENQKPGVTMVTVHSFAPLRTTTAFRPGLVGAKNTTTQCGCRAKPASDVVLYTSIAAIAVFVACGLAMAHRRRPHEPKTVPATHEATTPV